MSANQPRVILMEENFDGSMSRIVDLWARHSKVDRRLLQSIYMLGASQALMHILEGNTTAEELFSQCSKFFEQLRAERRQEASTPSANE